MAIKVRDRVQETTTTSGVGALTLQGAVYLYQSFATAGFATGDTTYYEAHESNTGQWEVGIGTYQAQVGITPASLARTLILASSNGGSVVNFTSAQKLVSCVYPAGRAVFTDGTPLANGQLLIGNPLIGGFASSQLTAGVGIDITSGPGAITITNTRLGDVVGPLTSTDRGIALFDGNLGDLLQSSIVTISSLGDVANVLNLSTTGNITSGGNITLSGNVNFFTTGQKVVGDFSNPSTVARIAFVTSQTNDLTSLTVLPNGTSTQSEAAYYDNSVPTVSAVTRIGIDGAEGYVKSDISGVGGTYKPLSFYAFNQKCMELRNNAVSLVATRVTGDFSNPVLADRVMFQTSSTGLETSLSALPNGGALASEYVAYNVNPTDNCGYLKMRSELGAAILEAGAIGSGGYDDFYLRVGGGDRIFGEAASGKIFFKVEGSSHFTHNFQYNEDGEINLLDQNGAVAVLIDSSNTHARFLNISTGQVYIGGSANVIFLRASGTVESGRFTTAGYFCVGTTTATPGGITQNGFINAVAPSGTNGVNVATVGPGTAIQFANTAFGQTGNITNGASTTAYNTVSDYRVKENIQPITDGLSVVGQLNPIMFIYKASKEKGIGFLAHELQEVCPHAVTGEKDAIDEDGLPVFQSVDTSFLIAPIVSAIQELTARVAELERKVNEVK